MKSEPVLWKLHPMVRVYPAKVPDMNLMDLNLADIKTFYYLKMIALTIIFRYLFDKVYKAISVLFFYQQLLMCS